MFPYSPQAVCCVCAENLVPIDTIVWFSFRVNWSKSSTFVPLIFQMALSDVQNSATVSPQWCWTAIGLTNIKSIKLNACREIMFSSTRILSAGRGSTKLDKGSTLAILYAGKPCKCHKITFQTVLNSNTQIVTHEPQPNYSSWQLNCKKIKPMKYETIVTTVSGDQVFKMKFGDISSSTNKNQSVLSLC